MVQDLRIRFDVLDVLPEPVMLVSLDGHVQAANRAMGPVLGVAVSSIVGRPLAELVEPGARPLTEYLRVCTRSREMVLSTLRVRGADDAEDYRVEGALVSSPDTGPRSILLRFTPKSRSSGPFVILNEKLDELNRQMKKRRKTEKQLREQKEWLHGTLASIGEGLIATDAAGRVRLLNEMAEQLTGWSADEAEGVVVSDLFHAALEHSGQEQVVAALEAIETGSVVKRTGMVLSDREGKRVPIQETAAPIRGEDGAIVGAVLVFRDVSRERRTTEEIQRAKEAAEAASRAKSEFLASVSHELRTPMNVIIGMTDLALETGLDAQVRDYLSTARESSSNLLHLLDDLLDLSKIEARGLDVSERPFRLRKTVYDAIRVMAVQAAEKELELLCDVDPAVPEIVRGDAARLRQILLNLIGNAIKFTSRGEICLLVKVKDDRGDSATVHFTARDTGSGISESHRARIFAPFFQADSSSRRLVGGTGLGLSIVSALVDRMGGELWVDSKLGEGSEFHFTLDYIVERRFDPSVDAQALPDALRGAPVLLVENHPSTRDVVANLLSVWGMRPTSASSGSEALARVSEAERTGRPFRLAIVNAKLPGTNGAASVEELTSHGVPSILMAPTVGHRDYQECSNVRAVSATVDKPLTPPNLMRALRSAFVRDELREPVGSRSSSRAKGSRSLHVLLAEDTPANQKLVTTLLNRAGHRVEIAADGLEAIELFENGSFDAVLMDVQMPRVDGFEATQRIRALEDTAAERTPIIALSAHALAGFREECLRAGMDDYMAKPFTGAELHERLMELTAGRDDAPARRTAAASRESQPADAGDAALQVFESFGGRFLQDFDHLMSEIREALETSNGSALERAAHALRGSSAFLRADAITGAATELEAIAKTAQLDGAREVADRLAQDIDRLRRRVDALERG